MHCRRLARAGPRQHARQLARLENRAARWRFLAVVARVAVGKLQARRSGSLVTPRIMSSRKRLTCARFASLRQPFCAHRAPEHTHRHIHVVLFEAEIAVGSCNQHVWCRVRTAAARCASRASFPRTRPKRPWTGFITRAASRTPPMTRHFKPCARCRSGATVQQESCCAPRRDTFCRTGFSV